MNKKMTNWAAWKVQSVLPIDVLIDIKKDIDSAIHECKEGNEEQLLKIVYDIYCDSNLFLKDFGTSAEDFE